MSRLYAASSFGFEISWFIKAIQLVEKLRCILSLPNLFPSLARRFPSHFAPFLPANPYLPISHHKLYLLYKRYRL